MILASPKVVLCNLRLMDAKKKLNFLMDLHDLPLLMDSRNLNFFEDIHELMLLHFFKKFKFKSKYKTFCKCI